MAPRLWLGRDGPSRRRLLRDAGRAALLAALPSCTATTGDATASRLWGAPRAGGEGLLLPGASTPSGTLEVFLLGAINPWDTFYVLPSVGEADRRMWFTFLDGPEGIEATFRNRCGGGDRPLLVDPFHRDSLGQDVHFGPFVEPLRDRPDILARARLFVMRHGQPAHETAVPLALCGHPQSSPRLAATPAHIERFMQDRPVSGHAAPWGAVLYPDLQDLVAMNGESASAVGLHRGSARPLSLRLGPEGFHREAFQRQHVASRAEAFDRLVRGYGAAYEGRLRPPEGARVRSPAFDDWLAGRSMLGRAPDILALLGDSAFSGRSGSGCGFESELDNTTMALDAAVHMLAHATQAPRWVTAIDGGLLPASAGAAYDTHIRHVVDSSRNLMHTMRTLVARINEPGEEDPNKLDLDRHMVLLTTEFGRTPVAIGDGLNHWSDAYVVLGFGGPFDAERKGIVGAIGPDAVAQGGISPADFRAAALLAMGIWPFSGQSFNVADIQEGGTEVEAAAWLREVVLGYPA